MSSFEDLEKGQRPSSMASQRPATRHTPPSLPSTVSVDQSIMKELPARRELTPKKAAKSRKPSRISRFLQLTSPDHFTTYRRIFALIFIVNLVVLIALVASTRGSPTPSAAGSAAAVNLAIGVLFRQEQVVNLLFYVLTSVPRSAPLWLRRHVAQVFHYGGVHSGCGVAAVAWYLLYTALATQAYVQQAPSARSMESLVTSWILVALFVLLLGGAFPAFRVRFHDLFEIFHRFAGWAALAVFWAHVLFTAHSTAMDGGTPMGLELARSLPFWCILVATLPVVASWAQLRKRAVRVEPLSDHATRLCFDYAELPPCYGVRVSTRPLLEWHSFATIPDTVPANPAAAAHSGTTMEADDQPSKALEISVSANPSTISFATAPSTTAPDPASPLPAPLGFSIVVSNAGDWTRRIIHSPPTHLYLRGSPLRGVIFGARLFHRVLIVATGSGIGPCLSLLVAHATLLPRRPRVLWSAPAPLATFGVRIVDSVREADPEAMVWDTREKGRPDLVGLAEEMAREGGCEAVFVISNPRVCGMMVRELGDRGVAAYAPILDS